MNSGPGRRKFLQVSLGTVGALMASCDGGAVVPPPGGSTRAPGISTASADASTSGEGGIPEGGSPDGSPVLRPVEPIPAEWHAESQKEFEVPPGGTDKADFAITSKKK